jgi:methylation protein EvaC
MTGICRISKKPTKSFMSFSMPLAGSFLSDINSPNEHFPITVEFCEDSGLVQVAEDIPPGKLFNEYMYKTGAIKTLVDHFDVCATSIKKNFKHNTIVEIGSNDFTFLKNFLNDSDRIIGVDPSDVAQREFVSLNTNNGLSLINTFFNKDIAKAIIADNPHIDIVYTSNCFAHISDILGVAEGVETLLTDTSSVFICEVHWLGSLIKNLQFPFIYHEHIFYYSLKSFRFLLNLVNIDVYKVEHIPTHGGSIRYYCCKKGARIIEQSVVDLENEEKDMGLYSAATFDNFGQRILILRDQTKQMLQSLKQCGQKIVAYGASGQANTFLSFYGIDSSLVPFIIDDSPLKIGKFTSSGLIPIKPSSFLYEHKPDYILCLAYTFFNEISKKHEALKAKWIIPLPNIKTIWTQ